MMANHDASLRRLRITHVVARVTRWRALSERVVHTINPNGIPLATSTSTLRPAISPENDSEVDASAHDATGPW